MRCIPSPSEPVTKAEIHPKAAMPEQLQLIGDPGEETAIRPLQKK
jgi:hypothetical protein